MRPKVKGDTFFLPDPEGIVYFRNNQGSFRMEGSMIDRWIEQLIPMFDGQHTLEALTDGLPEAHRNRVYEIAATLIQNGFARDASEDLPHGLPDGVLERFASQIDFLDAFGGSGANRFQRYRESEVLAAGSGPMLVSLVSSLLESGLSRFRIVACGSTPTDRRRIGELAAYARLTDPEVRIEEWAYGGNVPWSEVVGPFDRILYVSSEGGIPELQALHRVCVERKKTLLPAVFFAQVGMAGPLVSPESDGDWESARRRLHRHEIVKDPLEHAPSSVAEAMLANLLAFELFKSLTGTGVQELRDQIFLLNLETLEGSRHAIVPHPALKARYIEPLRERPLTLPMDRESGTVEAAKLFSGFTRLTSPVAGVLHCWDEGDYRQLPLSVCRVQAADPLSDGPAELLPEIVCGGLTHEQARREAGLAGIEAYATRLFERQPVRMGVGAGASVAEGIARGLHRCLQERLGDRVRALPPEGLTAEAIGVEDGDLAYYLRSLTILRGQPEIRAGQEILGFPVRWVRSGPVWYGAAGLNRTEALRSAAALALLSAQTGSDGPASAILQPVIREAEAEQLSAAEHALRRRGIRLAVYDLAIEPFMNDILAGVFGVVLREEGVR
ncbi:putative thiazole-containing bacteriocin maturation protein [Cohnella sp. CFH 77786]|nr:putative thiazole-containing bacteriocin maturation protein [Cohnella sp. CFH 77786]MBW5446308.1 putative thiazole-containing bacteriocin maturation protein [Cohnella sp. CFH 77786]